MTREKLESFVGKKVEIVLDNNDVVKGTLIKGKGIGLGQYIKHDKWYAIPEEHLSFRLSHVKKITENEK